ncbi:Ferroportin1 [Ostertagia ostertagi]
MSRSQRISTYLKENKTFLRSASALNVAFLISALGDRLWMFAIGLFLHQLGGISWIAIHQLLDSLAKLILTPVLGSMLDKTNRNRGMQAVLFVNNVAISLSALIFFFNLSETHRPASNWMKTLYLLFAILFGSVSRVASEAQKTAFTKDWIVVVIAKTKGARLSTQNAAMTVIDQTSSFLTPLIAGVMLDSMSRSMCCLVIIGWNILSWSVEASMLLWIYRRIPALAHRMRSDSTSKEPSCDDTPSPAAAYSAYFRQSSFRAAFGLALLYMTVLGFDNLALSYGASQGMSASTLGLFRSIGSLLGLLGALSYTAMERVLGLLWTGLIGLMLQNIFINLCSLSIVLPGSPFNATGYFSSLTTTQWVDGVRSTIFGGLNTTESLPPLPFSELSPSILVFFFGITLARFGLWIADPSITQIMQETIPERERYSVFGVQTSICEFFSVLKDVMITCNRSRCRSGEGELNSLKLPEQEHLVNKHLMENAVPALDV